MIECAWCHEEIDEPDPYSYGGMSFHAECVEYLKKNPTAGHKIRPKSKNVMPSYHNHLNG